LFGEAGRDHLNGGAGRDRCDGGDSRADTAFACEKTTNVP
jgi:hypothetical protein